jgi:alpha/beta hydrolase fold
MHGVSRWVLPCLVITAVSFSLAFGEDKFFDFAGVRIRYIDQGSGEPVLVAHGYTNAIERNWIENGVLADLVTDHRVIAFDMRGHGKSDKPHDPRGIEAQAMEFESSSVPYRTMVLTMTGLDEPVPTEDEIRRQSMEIASRNDPKAHATMFRGLVAYS